MHELYMNLDYGSVRASKIAQEGIESKVGPKNYTIKKAVEASHHHENFKYGESVVTFTRNAYIAIVLPVIKNINLRKLLNLVYILEQGDRIFI